MSLELEAFAETIVSMPQRALGAKPHRALDDSPVNSMALKSDSAEGKSVTKIVYPPCRTGVFAPSDWDDYYARRSADAPKEDLAAEWAYGCSVAGKCGMLAAAPKTWTDEPTRKADVTSDADESMDEWMNPGGYRGVVWVYACGAMGVVFDANAWRQRFFRGHDDEITSLTTHAAGR
jgi:microtubule-associated protein-like 6